MPTEVKATEREISLCTIKEANLEFMTGLISYAQDFLDEKYGEGNAKGFMRTGMFGGHEMFAIIKEKE